jgi:hypothetical protein
MNLAIMAAANERLEETGPALLDLHQTDAASSSIRAISRAVRAEAIQVDQLTSVGEAW